MLLSDVNIESLAFTEALATVLTSEPVSTVVDSLVALQSCACREGLAAAITLADMFPFEGMRAFDVLFEVLVFDVVFVAIWVRTFEWARVGM